MIGQRKIRRLRSVLARQAEAGREMSLRDQKIRGVLDTLARLPKSKKGWAQYLVNENIKLFDEIEVLFGVLDATEDALELIEATPGVSARVDQAYRCMKEAVDRFHEWNDRELRKSQPVLRSKRNLQQSVR